jgi:hypothetical protein
MKIFLASLATIAVVTGAIAPASAQTSSGGIPPLTATPMCGKWVRLQGALLPLKVHTSCDLKGRALLLSLDQNPVMDWEILGIDANGRVYQGGLNSRKLVVPPTHLQSVEVQLYPRQ